ncbi:HCLS1-binding protein 3 isoform X2 [Lethenteron reissneri]|uniref:HCLS1-binding protein 3 isoform X2 n=1 Tax=Lethenteron reissneri TaxID=7753 RepID=UPI002AB7377A|nr:HCLS1-binding protein 3 isoform X2 [Lethenteron reissneri]
MREATLTTRQLQNSVSGLDLHVLDFAERREGMRGHVEYRVLAVTRLACFKAPTLHGPADNVQFTVQRSFSQFEELARALAGRFPGSALPPMPRRALLVGEAELQERRGAFHRLLQAVARDASLATAPETLHFLDANSEFVTEPWASAPRRLDAPDEPSERSFFGNDDARDDEDEEVNFGQRHTRTAGRDATASRPAPAPRNAQPAAPRRDTGGARREAKAPEPAEESSSDEADDPLGVMKKKKAPAPSPKPPPAPAPSRAKMNAPVRHDPLFPTRAPAAARDTAETWHGEAARLFDAPDLGGAVRSDDPLLLPPPELVGEPSPAPTSGFTQDEEELLNVADDLEDILKLRSKPKPKPKPKPRLPPKPGGVRGVATSSLAPPKEGGTSQALPTKASSSMDATDILAYIQENAGDDEPLSLF